MGTYVSGRSSSLLYAPVSRTNLTYDHTPTGWSIFDRLYILNGTIYIVSDEPEAVPERHYMISSAVFIGNSPEEVAARMPTDQVMRVISTAEARQLFGTEAERMDGVSVRSRNSLSWSTVLTLEIGTVAGE